MLSESPTHCELNYSRNSWSISCRRNVETRNHLRSPDDGELLSITDQYLYAPKGACVLDQDSDGQQGRFIPIFGMKN